MASLPFGRSYFKIFHGKEQKPIAALGGSLCNKDVTRKRQERPAADAKSGREPGG